MVVFDSDACARALDFLFEDGHVYELRVLGFQGRNVVSGYYNDPVRMHQAAADHSGKAEGIYMVLNPVDPRLLDRSRNRMTVRYRGGDMTLDAEVLERHWLMVDFDPIRPKGVSSTEEEHDAALCRAIDCRDFLVKRRVEDRMLLADSGNGAHLLINWVCPNNEEQTNLAAAFLQMLDGQFTDEQVKVDTCTYNANRLCKFYGTLAMKGDSSPTNPHRLARLVEEINGTRITLVE